MIEIYYEWEDSRNRQVVQEIGENIIDSITSSKPVESNSDYLGVRIDEIIWPYFSYQRNIGEKAIRMILVPLDRLGQSQGKSGSKVLLCYFEYDNMLPSIPMIIKREEKNQSGKKFSHVNQEFNNAQKIYPFIRRKDIFILPFYKASLETVDFIVSNSIVNSPNRRIDMSNSHIETFMDRLRSFELQAFAGEDVEKKKEELVETINFLYVCLRDLHLGPFVCNKSNVDKKEYLDEYKKYLRGMDDSNKKEKICSFWCGKARNPECHDCPVLAFEKVVNKEVPFHLGCIHGDFHPRNIVYLTVTSPIFNDVSIIDYGWADNLAHIAKDYVLMECNLRFMSISSRISPSRLRILQKSIETETLMKNIKSCVNIYESGIYEMIICLRNSFFDTIKELNRNNQVDYNNIFYEEYVIPLFLVGYGLLKYYGESENQLAHRIMLEELAKYILQNEE